MNSQTTFSPKTHRQLSAANWRRAIPGDALLVKRRRYYLYSFDVDKGWQQNSAVPCIDLDNGQLYVNGIQIVHPKISHHHITWLQHATDSNGTHYLAGHLHLHSNGLEAHGVVIVGKNHQDAIQHTVFASVIPSVFYKTRITSARYPSNTDPSELPPSAWQDGLSLEIGYQLQEGNSVPQPMVKLDDQDISYKCAWSANDRYTVLTITLDGSDCQFVSQQFYALAKLSFDALILNAPGIGNVSRTCGDPIDPGDTVQLWSADLAESSAGATSNKSAVSTFIMPQPERIPIASANLLSTASNNLTINELMTLLPNDVVNDDANTMLMRNMKWAMGQDKDEKQWLKQYFNETPPVIADPDQETLAKQGLDWYQQDFAMSYLTQSFNGYSGPNEPKHRLSKDQATNLNDFLETGLAKDPDFNVQHQGIFIDAYVGVNPRLAQYIADPTQEVVGWAQGKVVFSRDDTSAELTVRAGVTVKTATGVVFMTQAANTLAAGQKTSAPVDIAANEVGQSGVVAANTITQFGDQPAPGITAVTNPEPTTLNADKGGMKWAKKLFTVLTTGTQFIFMVNRIAGAAGDPAALAPANNFACLLTALDPSGTIAQNYLQSVLSGVVVKLVPDVVQSDKDTIMYWLPPTMDELFRKLAAGELPQEADISETEAKEMSQEYQKHKAEFNSALADLLIAVSNITSGLMEQAKAAEARFVEIATRWPKLAKASRFMLPALWIGGVTSVIVALVKGDWKNMTDVERATFVTDCVQLTVTGFKVVPIVWQGTKSVTMNVWNKLNDWWNRPVQQQQIISQQSNVAKLDRQNMVERESRNIDELIEVSEATGTPGKSTIYERLFREGKFSTALKVVGAAVAVAMAAFSCWQLIKDIRSHGSITTLTFDSLMLAATFLAAVCAVADLFIVTTVIPIAGAVLAIFGVIIGVFAGFFEKPDNPLDDWMVDHGIPFVKGLPSQTPSPVTAPLPGLPA